MGQILRVEGGQPLTGRVTISGAKNSAAAILPAATLAAEPCFLRHVPLIADVQVLLDILNAVGFSTRLVPPPDGTDRAEAAGAEVEVRQVEGLAGPVPHDLAKRLRASILFLGPLLTRFGHARVALPGGCDIGSRPIDLHLKGL
ncbi:MAG: UDP-N-acetylglucosamine 1-carboxyvinyltransferase, partial [Bacteroidota bacterium]